MKITLVAMDTIITCYGLRILSSALKKQYHQVNLVFARAEIGLSLPDKVQRKIVDLCSGSDLVGISLMSNHFPQARDLTAAIKKRMRIPVIWGGVHPTFCPEQCLDYADMVCLGEGEISFLSLIEKISQKRNYLKTKGIWFQDKRGIVRNPPERLVDELDHLPFPDFGSEDHYIRDGEVLKKMSSWLFQKYLTKRKVGEGKFEEEYYISTSRGCPFRCAYCASNTIKNLYPGQRFYRLRAPGKIITEVKGLTKKFKFIKWIYFADDDLFSSPIKRIKIFCDLWEKEIGLPFYATTTPWSYSDKKLKLFIDAGIGIVNMGIQTVSKRGVAVFHRPAPKRKILTVINRINKLMKDKYKSIPPLYDFILDNPYETDKDRLENLDFMLKISQPRKLNLFSLVPFPGSEIYNRMKKDGLLVNEEKMIYQKCYSYPEANYINMLMFLADINFPEKFIKLLRGKMFLLIFNNRLSKWLFKKIPYSAFLIVARNLFNFRFWRFNLTPKGEF